VLWATAFAGSHTAPALAEATTSKLQLESAYLYNFLLFAHWPHENEAEASGPLAMTICIVGDDALAANFAPVVDKTIKDTKYLLKVKTIRTPLPPADLKGCALLFIAAQAPDPLPEILAQVKGLPILTVSDRPDFATMGGMLALVEQNGKLRWRINQGAATLVGLRFDAQLLRNADAVINAGQEGH
jgi:hypothetical protein